MERIVVPEKGISFGLAVDGEFVNIDEDGYVGRLTPRMNAEIHLWVAPGYDDLYAVDVDGRKNIVLRRPASVGAEGRHYRQRIQIKESQMEAGIYHTEYPVNNIRALWLPTEGALEFHLGSLFSQNNDFYCTVQQTERARCYVGRYGIECPNSRYGGRPQNLTFFDQLLGERVNLLPSIDSYKPELDVPFTFKPGVNVGRGKWYTDAEGTGGIEVLQGIGKTVLARVHWTQIAKRGRRRYLREGEKVSFEVLRTPEKRGRETAFQLEAIGVKVVD